MNDERDRILRMVRESKISKEEGDELLAALEASSESKAETARPEPSDVTQEKAVKETSSTPQQASPSRSVGVIVAAFVLIFLCLARFLEHSALVFFNRPWIIGMKPLHLTSNCFVGGWSPLGSFTTLFALLILIGAAGVLFFKEWARKFLVIALALHAFFAFFGTMMMRGIGISRFDISLVGLVSCASLAGWIIVDIFFIWYFSRASIRPQFS